MISIYVRIVYYLRKTQSGPFPKSLLRTRFPRFLFIATGNETVDNCAARFIKLCDELASFHSPFEIKTLLGRKYAKSFTTVSIDERVKEIANKGKQFLINNVSFIFLFKKI
jgi:hypothetical protein